MCVHADADQPLSVDAAVRALASRVLHLRVR